MIAESLSRSAAVNAWLPWLTCAGLVIFFAFFVGMLAWVCRRGGREFYGEMGNLPLAPEAGAGAGRLAIGKESEAS